MAEGSRNPPVFALLLASAQQDLAACQLLVASPGIGDAIVGFHAQQAVEKSLKAVLSANLIEFRRTHDLIALLDLLEDSNLPPPPNPAGLTSSTPMRSTPGTAPSIPSGWIAHMPCGRPCK